MSDLLDAALDYAARGWPVFPCAPGEKCPLGELVPDGHKNATTDHKQIRSWWSIAPWANIGLRTGEQFDALDLDGPSALKAVLAMGVGMPPLKGPTVATPRGWHIYVAPTGIGCKAGLLPGVDWRGNGGYVLAPPSVRRDGGRYEWIDGFPSDLSLDAQLAPAPGWILDLVNRKSQVDHAQPSGPRATTSNAYGPRAQQGVLGDLAKAEVGGRNHALNYAAFRIGQLAAKGHLVAPDAIKELAQVARQIGLSDSEIENTINSGFPDGFTKGLRHVDPS